MRTIIAPSPPSRALARGCLARGCLALALAALSGAAFADIVSGNGRIETERRSLPAFASIDVGGSGKLMVHRGPRKVQVTCDSNILPYVTTEVVGGRLRIGLKPFTALLGVTKLEYDVTLPELSGLYLSGSGDAVVDAFEGGDFEARVSGSGGIEAELAYDKIKLQSSGSGGFAVKAEAASLELRCSGSGEAFLEGKSDRADLTLSGSGRLGARGFAAGAAKVAISGSGDAEIRASRELSVSISGSGSVRYWGSPSVSEHVSGSGRVSKAGN